MGGATEVTIGIDIGTTSVKAVAADGDGNVVARARWLLSHGGAPGAASALILDASPCGGGRSLPVHLPLLVAWGVTEVEIWVVDVFPPGCAGEGQ